MKSLLNIDSATDPFNELITVTIGVWDNKTEAKTLQAKMVDIFNSPDLCRHMVMLDLRMDFSSQNKSLDITFESVESEEDHVNGSNIQSLYDTLKTQLNAE